MNKKNEITSASPSEYFSKNLQQIGFSSPVKAMLTSIKEAVDNALDACEQEEILPEVWLEIEKLGLGLIKNTDNFRLKVRDNGPGINEESLGKVFGEYLASSKFNRGKASRGQQGIGISSVTTYAQKTSARGAQVITKTKKQKKAISAIVECDIKNNKGIVRSRKEIEPTFNHGTEIEYTFDAKLQVNGDAGVLTYLNGTALVNPHLTLHYKLPDEKWINITRVSNICRKIPDAVNPHPHTMKLGDMIDHAHIYGEIKTKNWLIDSFSRMSKSEIKELIKVGVDKKILEKDAGKLIDAELKLLYSKIQELKLSPPSTKSVVSIGEEGLSKAINRLGNVDFFAVVTRKPAICDFKPVQIEVAMARLAGANAEDSAQVLRFANFVPLQFDKSSDVSVKAIESVNWRSYGLVQPKNSIPQGPYVIAVSVVSPFIKFKNASKETIDASDDLMEEIRLALIQAGQRLSKHIKAESKKEELEEKRKYMAQYGPILIESLLDITHEKRSRAKTLEKGLSKILGRETNDVKDELDKAEAKVKQMLNKEVK